jgi:alanyl-tRNA synthetase
VKPVIDRVAEIVGRRYEPDAPDAPRLRRIADHARAAVFCVADGVRPSNEGRGYVLRRILRRAIRDGVLLDLDEPFLADVVPAVVRAMSDGYPDLVSGEKAVRAVVSGEEEQFRETYAKGLRFLEQELARLGAATVVPGAVAFRLYDTYGFPLDLAEQILSERGKTVERAGFDRELEAQRERARSASKMAGDVFATGPLGELKARGAKPTAFAGYFGTPDAAPDGCEAEATVVGILNGDAVVAEAGPGAEVTVVLDRTPFYAEGGGQVGDQGSLEAAGGPRGDGVRVAVTDTQAREGFHLHAGKVETGVLRAGQRVRAVVDRARRDATRRNHTATHLLHEALKRVLGPHVEQQGSLVAPDRLRFDFRHPKGLSPDEVRRIEDLVNAWVLENADVDTAVMDTAAAKASGAVALFGENYGDVVRVVGVPVPDRTGFVSRELCGGTHVRRAGDIGSFRVVSEGSVASGVRRIEAVTGLGAVAAAAADRDRLRDLAALVKAPPDQVGARIEALQEELRVLRRGAEKAAAQAGARLADDLAARATPIGGVRVLLAEAKGVDAKGLRGLWDAVARAGVQVGLLVGESGDKAPVLAASGVPGANAKDLLDVATKVLGGGGGGRADLAQGQGADRARISEALSAARSRLEAVLSK